MDTYFRPVTSPRNYENKLPSYGFETWSVTVREEHRLRVLEKGC